MKNLNYKAKADYSLDKIGRDVSAIVRTNLRDEMVENLKENPKITTVDYTEGNATYKKEADDSTFSPYNMYSNINDQGMVVGKRQTPERAHVVTEIFKDGTKAVSSKEDFEKKLDATKPTEKELGELERLVRVSSNTPEDYANANARSKKAYEDFDDKKYMIEETAARVGVPASLLSSVYFKFMADGGSLSSATPNERYARFGYSRLYGKPLTWDSETLNSYLKTPEGILDFIAIGLKSEAKYYEYDIFNMSKSQMLDILTSYGKWHDYPKYYGDSVMAYNDIFKSIYAKLPGKDREVTVIS